MMVELAAPNRFPAFYQQRCLHGEKHAGRSCREVNPDRRPDICRQRGCKSAGRVHAEPGERRLKGDVTDDEQAGEQAGVMRDARLIGDEDDHRHHDEGDYELAAERDDRARGTGNGDHVLHWRLREGPANGKGGEQHAGETARNWKRM